MSRHTWQQNVTTIIAIPLRSATADSKTPFDYARTSTPKAARSHRYSAAQKRQTDRSRTRRTEEVLYPTQSPCNINAAITVRFPASRGKPACLDTHTHGNKTWQPSCSHSTAICNHRFQNIYNYARTSTPKAAWSHRYMAAKKRQTDRSRNRHTQEVPFIAGCNLFTRKNARFRAPASSPTQAPCNAHAAITMRFAAFPSSPLPLVTTSQSHHFPKSPFP